MARPRPSKASKSAASGGGKSKSDKADKSKKPVPVYGTKDFIFNSFLWGVLPIMGVLLLGYLGDSLLGSLILGESNPRLLHDERINLDRKIFRPQLIPGKGFGAIAYRDIKAGELIIQEKPVILMENKRPPLELPELLDKMDNVTRTAVLSLSYHSLPPGVSADLRNQSDSDRLSLAMAILDTNGVGVRNNEIGIFPRMARLNHACSSAINTIYSWQDLPEGGGELSVRAIKPIQKGEELTLYYMDTRKPREERRQYLKERYHFTCECPVCSLPLEKSTESDARLSQMTTLYNQFDTYANGSITGKEAADIARSILRLEDEEEYFHERAKMAEEMTWVAASASDERAAREWAKLSLKWYALGLGPDHPQTRTMSQLHQLPKTHNQWGLGEKEAVGGPGAKYI